MERKTYPIVLFLSLEEHTMNMMLLLTTHKDEIYIDQQLQANHLCQCVVTEERNEAPDDMLDKNTHTKICLL